VQKALGEKAGIGKCGGPFGQVQVTRRVVRQREVKSSRSDDTAAVGG